MRPISTTTTGKPHSAASRGSFDSQGTACEPPKPSVPPESRNRSAGPIRYAYAPVPSPSTAMHPNAATSTLTCGRP